MSARNIWRPCTTFDLIHVMATKLMKMLLEKNTCRYVCNNVRMVNLSLMKSTQKHYNKGNRG